MTAPPLTTNTRTYPATREGVTAALTALGDTADRVANTLAGAGYLGSPGESQECPVAVYLRDVVTPTWRVSIGAASAYVFPHGKVVAAPLPFAVRVFVDAFDL